MSRLELFLKLATTGLDEHIDSISKAGLESLRKYRGPFPAIVGAGITGGRRRIRDGHVRDDARLQAVLLGVLQDGLQPTAVLFAPHRLGPLADHTVVGFLAGDDRGHAARGVRDETARGRRIAQAKVRPALDMEFERGLVAVEACRVQGGNAARVRQEKDHVSRALFRGRVGRTHEQGGERDGHKDAFEHGRSLSPPSRRNAPGAG